MYHTDRLLCNRNQVTKFRDVSISPEIFLAEWVGKSNKQNAGIIGGYKNCTKDRDTLIKQSDTIKYQPCIANCYKKNK